MGKQKGFSAMGIVLSALRHIPSGSRGVLVLAGMELFSSKCLI